MARWGTALLVLAGGWACSGTGADGAADTPGDAAVQDLTDPGAMQDAAGDLAGARDAAADGPSDASADGPSDAPPGGPGDAPAEAAAKAPFASPCTADEDCESDLCFTYGTGAKACTIPCDSAADCPEGSQGRKCNGKGVCAP